MQRKLWAGILLLMGLVLLASCAPAALSPEPPGVEQPVETRVVTVEAEGESGAEIPSTPPEAAGEGQPATNQPLDAVPTQPVTTEPDIETWLGEAEWPSEMRMGDSDTVRLKLLPDEQGYTVSVDFPEHTSQLEPLTVRRPEGMILTAFARLEGISFEISPQAEQSYTPLPGEPLEWTWTIRPKAAGQQRLALSAVFEWRPAQVSPQQAARQSVVYNHAINVDVQPLVSVPGLLIGGLAGLLLIAALVVVPAFWFYRRSTRMVTRFPRPNHSVQVESSPGIQLNREEQQLLQAMFPTAGRLLLEEEFLSGYSGARTLLVLPIQPDGRKAARVIVKLGSQQSIEKEYQNYQAYVKDSLPPVTAHIKSPPIGMRGRHRAALPYTFIATPSVRPISLRQALQADPDPAIIYQLFDTFGPGWWMQRHPYTFRFGYEYDRMLSSHLTLEPAEGPEVVVDGRTSPDQLSLSPGDVILLKHFNVREIRPDQASWTLVGQPPAGMPPIRVRWKDAQPPSGRAGRILSTRESFLAETISGFRRFDAPDPLPLIPDVLTRTVHGTRAFIHGDLNLENILIGPGDTVWLIDFAQTREGHTLFDFAHLYAEIVAHILTDQEPDLQDYYQRLKSHSFPLLKAVEELTRRCLYDPHNLEELNLALFTACLGALKFENISAAARQRLYLTAALWAQQLDLP